MRFAGFLVRGFGMNATSQLFAEPCSLLLASFLSLFLIRLVFFQIFCNCNFIERKDV